MRRATHFYQRLEKEQKLISTLRLTCRNWLTPSPPSFSHFFCFFLSYYPLNIKRFHEEKKTKNKQERNRKCQLFRRENRYHTEKLVRNRYLSKNTVSYFWRENSQFNFGSPVKFLFQKKIAKLFKQIQFRLVNKDFSREGNLVQYMVSWLFGYTWPLLRPFCSSLDDCLQTGFWLFDPC